MDEAEKEKLREMSTRLLGMEMRLKNWVEAMNMEIHRVNMERNVIHNIVERLQEED